MSSSSHHSFTLFFSLARQTPQGDAFLEKHREDLANLHIVAQTKQLRGIHTVIRDKACERSDFVFQSDRLIRMAVEEALSLLPTEPKEVVTPTGAVYDGLRFSSKICAVSIPRSGDTMEQGIRQVVSDVRIGKILIQRDEHTSKPVLLYSKLPLDIADRIVLLLDPMLATGGSAIRAIEVLLFLLISLTSYSSTKGAAKAWSRVQERYFRQLVCCSRRRSQPTRTLS